MNLWRIRSSCHFSEHHSSWQSNEAETIPRPVLFLPSVVKSWLPCMCLKGDKLFLQLHLYVYLTVRVLPLVCPFWRKRGKGGTFKPPSGGSLPISYWHIYFPLFPPPPYYSVWLSFSTCPNLFNSFPIFLRYKSTLYAFSAFCFSEV